MMELQIPSRAGAGALSAQLPQPLAGLNVLDRPPGYHDLYPDVSVNFQLNRFLSWMTPEALPDVAKVAAGTRGYANLTTSFLALGDRLLTEQRLLDAAFCFRLADFFLLPGDPRRAPARRQFVDLVRNVYGIRPEHVANVPYSGARLPAYRFGTREKGAGPWRRRPPSRSARQCAATTSCGGSLHGPSS